jgi:DNA-binding NarL/FixJ family response regulator
VSKVSILVADDIAFWREFACSVIGREPSFEIIWVAVDGQQAVVMAERLQPKIALLDVGLPGLNGIDAAIGIRKLAPHTRIVFLSLQTDLDVVQAALHVGSGYVAKTDAATELVPAIYSVAKGERFLSHQFADLRQENNF